MYFVTTEKNAYTEIGGFEVTFIRQGHNFTSILHVQDLDLNETTLTCEGVMVNVDMDYSETKNDTITICVRGTKLCHYHSQFIYYLICPRSND